MTTTLLALVAGALIGFSLGTLGAGGSILAVPVLVHGLGQTPTQAMTGSLLVVAVTSAIAGAAARRRGSVALGQGLAFALVASGGAIVGGSVAKGLNEDWLMAAFGLLLLVVAALTWWRHQHPVAAPQLAGPIVQLGPQFRCSCRRALAVLVTASAVGLLTGLLGVGGGFVVVPALVLALGMSLAEAAGTSLVVMTVTSMIALTTRLGHGIAPDPLPVLLLTAAATAAALWGGRWAQRLDPKRLSLGFTGLLAVVGLVVSATSLPAVF